MNRAFLLVVLALLTGACRARPIPDEQRYPAGTPFRAQYRTIDGTRLRLIDSGRGTPVVFIHGIGASLYSWRHTLPPVVSAGYRVVAFDNRGFGFSEQPAHGYRNADYVRLVVALLDSLWISSAVLVGHAIGGTIAADVAGASRPGARSGVDRCRRVRRALAGVLKIARWPLWRSRHHVSGAMVHRTYSVRRCRSTKVTETDVDQYYQFPRRFGRALQGVLREFRFDSPAVGCPEYKTPNARLWVRPIVIPVRDGARFARELPRSEFFVIDRSGHNAHEESPDRVNQLLLDFLKEGLSRIPENVAWYSPPPPPPYSRFRSLRKP